MVDLDSFKASFTRVQGISHPDWDLFYDTIEKAGFELEAGSSEWDTVLKVWLDRLCQDLGSEFKLYESENFYVVSGLGDKASYQLIGSSESALHLIGEALTDFRSEEKWRIVLIAIPEFERYQSYLSHYSNVGRTAGTSGMFLSGAGYQHIVVCAGNLLESQATVAHELTHYLLGELPLPTWLNEGLASTIEKTVMGESLTLTHEDLRRHRIFWDKERVEGFWSGEVFERIDSDPSLTYDLSEILVRNLLTDDKKYLIGFIKDAHFDDGGIRAGFEHFDCDLRELVEQFLKQDDILRLGV